MWHRKEKEKIITKMWTLCSAAAPKGSSDQIIPNIVDTSFRSNAQGQCTHSARTNMPIFRVIGRTFFGFGTAHWTMCTVNTHCLLRTWSAGDIYSVQYRCLQIFLAHDLNLTSLLPLMDLTLIPLLLHDFILKQWHSIFIKPAIQAVFPARSSRPNKNSFCISNITEKSA